MLSRTLVTADILTLCHYCPSWLYKYVLYETEKSIKVYHSESQTNIEVCISEASATSVAWESSQFPHDS
jgi:hypothetical protein